MPTTQDRASRAPGYYHVIPTGFHPGSLRSHGWRTLHNTGAPLVVTQNGLAKCVVNKRISDD